MKMLCHAAQLLAGLAGVRSFDVVSEVYGPGHEQLLALPDAVRRPQPLRVESHSVPC